SSYQESDSGVAAVTRRTNTDPSGHAIKRLDAELVLLAEKKLLLDYAARKLVWPNDLPALAKYSLSILLPKTPLLNRQIDPAV
ncbi:hypothetical protein L249_3094, partial [Ophiocordyceps polyrhachis-furcata BCC 54312]